jgi:hypothetical protein
MESSSACRPPAPALQRPVHRKTGRQGAQAVVSTSQLASNIPAGCAPTWMLRTFTQRQFSAPAVGAGHAPSVLLRAANAGIQTTSRRQLADCQHCNTISGRRNGGVLDERSRMTSAAPELPHATCRPAQTSGPGFRPASRTAGCSLSIITAGRRSIAVAEVEWFTGARRMVVRQTDEITSKSRTCCRSGYHSVGQPRNLNTQIGRDALPVPPRDAKYWRACLHAAVKTWSRGRAAMHIS